MIETARVGMRIKVVMEDCCFGMKVGETGEILKVMQQDSFSVREDKDGETWWQCRKCVEEIK